MGLRAAILGAGFIGRNFVNLALSQGYDLRVLDHNDCPIQWAGLLSWSVGDLGSEEDLNKVLKGADTVFHFVSSTVPGDLVDESSELRQNVFQTLQLLRLCVQHSVRQVVFISSASVYGPQRLLPIGETAPTDPISSHGIHKLAIEKYLQLYEHQHGVACKILRLANPYGPGQRTNSRQGFVGIAIGRMLAGAGMQIRGDGSHVRDFIHIDDVCHAIHLVATRHSEHRVFNVGSGEGRSLNQILALLRQLSQQAIPADYTASRFVDIPASVLDVSRMRLDFGWTPAISLHQGLGQTLRLHGLVADSK